MFLGNFMFFTTTMITLLKKNSQIFLVIFISLSDIYALSFGMLAKKMLSRDNIQIAKHFSNFCFQNLFIRLREITQ